MTVMKNGVTGVKRQYKRKSPMTEKQTIPRTELEVLENISSWCSDTHPEVQIQKSECEKLIESTGEKKVIDATVIGYHKRRTRAGADKCLIAELEFEEHRQKKYSILEDMLEITIPLRKLSYYRADIFQYWIKIDRDGTPFMVNYRYIKENERNTDKMHPHGCFTRADQLVRINVASRDTKESSWPPYVIIGWEKIFKELHRVIKMAGF